MALKPPLRISGYEASISIDETVIKLRLVGGTMSYQHPNKPEAWFSVPTSGVGRDESFWTLADAIVKDFGHEGDEQSTGTLKDMLEDFFGTEAN